jgi:hypothetical protein
VGASDANLHGDLDDEKMEGPEKPVTAVGKRALQCRRGEGISRPANRWKTACYPFAIDGE